MGINWQLLWYDLARRAERGELSVRAAWRERGWKEMSSFLAAPFFMLSPAISFGLRTGTFFTTYVYAVTTLWMIVCVEGWNPVQGRRHLESGKHLDLALLAHRGVLGYVAFAFLGQLLVGLRCALWPAGLIGILFVGGYTTAADCVSIVVLCVVCHASTLAIGLAWNAIVPFGSSAGLGPLTFVLGSFFVVSVGWSAWMSYSGTFAWWTDEALRFVPRFFRPGGWNGYEYALLLVGASWTSAGLLIAWGVLRGRIDRKPAMLKRRRRVPGKRDVRLHDMVSAAMSSGTWLDSRPALVLSALVLVPMALLPIYGPLVILFIVPTTTWGAFYRLRRDPRWDDIVLASTDSEALGRGVITAMARRNAYILPAFATLLVAGNVTMGALPDFNLVHLAQRLFADWSLTWALLGTVLATMFSMAGCITLVAVLTLLPLQDAVRFTSPEEIMKSRTGSPVMLVLSAFVYGIWLWVVWDKYGAFRGRAMDASTFFGVYLSLFIVTMPLPCGLAYSAHRYFLERLRERLMAEPAVSKALAALERNFWR